MRTWKAEIDDYVSNQLRKFIFFCFRSIYRKLYGVNVDQSCAAIEESE